VNRLVVVVVARIWIQLEGSFTLTAAHLVSARFKEIPTCLPTHEQRAKPLFFAVVQQGALVESAMRTVATGHLGHD